MITAPSLSGGKHNVWPARFGTDGSEEMERDEKNPRVGDLVLLNDEETNGSRVSP